MSTETVIGIAVVILVLVMLYQQAKAISYGIRKKS